MIATNAWLLPALPALATVLLLVFGRRIGAVAPWLAVLTTAIPFGLAIPMLVQADDHPTRVVTTSHVIAPLGSLSVSATTSVDGLAALMCLVVTTVALLVQIYSTAYMSHDSRHVSYAAFVSLFTSAMLVVVLSSDLLTMLVGWEVMGVCSYLLIGHHWEERPNTDAAISAFMVTRLGDLGFTAGIAILSITAGSTSIQTVLGTDRSVPVTEIASVLLLIGVIGKSAQLPLHTWLPDAMAGPTPVSALIHAATMVAAGVYVVARMAPVVLSTDTSRTMLALVAAVTMLFAALCAFAQDDLKRVLAWSTISQLAFMYAALAVGSTDAGISHLLTHAAFKALLFLGAGCVAHLVGSTLFADMGGLRTSKVVTVTMTIGLAALGGFPFLSGFVSKDAILEHAMHAFDTSTGSLHAATLLVVLSGVLTAAITAAYCTRTWIRIFAGSSRKPRRDSIPRLMTWPVAVLSIPALGLGLLLLRGDLHALPFPVRVGDTATLRSHFEVNLNWLLISTLAALIGSGLTLGVWRRQPDADPARVLGSARLFLRDGMRLDQLYRRIFVRPVRDGLAVMTSRFDTLVIDGAVRGTGAVTEESGRRLRRLHTGNVQLYLSVLVVGVLIVAIGASAL